MKLSSIDGRRAAVGATMGFALAAAAGSVHAQGGDAQHLQIVHADGRVTDHQVYSYTPADVVLGGSELQIRPSSGERFALPRAQVRMVCWGACPQPLPAPVAQDTVYGSDGEPSVGLVIVSGSYAVQGGRERRWRSFHLAAPRR